MDSIAFESLEFNVDIDETIRERIQDIYSIVREEKILDLEFYLKGFKDYLIIFYGIKTKEYSLEWAKSFYSQFLQHLFHYIMRPRRAGEPFVQESLLVILTSNYDVFYYNPIIAGEIKFNLWVDLNTKETALIGACRKADAEVVSLLLENLASSFQLSETTFSIPPALEHYLFHENELSSVSALTLTWLKGNRNNEASLLRFAKKYYGSESTTEFRRFLFQVDANGDSVLMRVLQQQNKKLMNEIFEGIGRAYGGLAQQGIQHVLNHQNRQGMTALHKAIEVNSHDLMDFLLKKGAKAFNGVASQGFEDFLLHADQQGTTPLILASKNGRRILINRMFHYVKYDADLVTRLLMQQDKQGYSALMRATEAGHTESIDYLLNHLINAHFIFDSYDSEGMLDCLNMKTDENYSVFQIAARKGDWQVLENLFESLRYVSAENSRDFIRNIEFFDASGISLLTRLYREEATLLGQLSYERREANSLEKKLSTSRFKLAKRLVNVGLRSSEEITIPSWRFVGSANLIDDAIDFVAIFCLSGNRRLKRSLANRLCVFDLTQAKGSMPENPTLLRKETVINMLALFKHNVNSIEQIGLIRNRASISEREKIELNRFNEEVEHYFNAHGPSVLSDLKAITVPTLEAAFAVPHSYILVDSGDNLLLLNKNHLFASFLNPVKLVPLNPEITTNQLKLWLDIYFSRHYTLHPFDSVIVNRYPLVLNGLEQEILSDSEILNRPYEGLRGSALRELFLLDTKSIELSVLTRENFFTNYENRLSFRIENFHENFFALSNDERLALKRILIRYDISSVNYAGLATEENEYLTIYGSKVIGLIKSNTRDDLLSPIELFDLAVDTHEALLSRENSLSRVEKGQLINALKELKSSLTLSENGAAHGKAALQLTVLLFPTAIRAFVKKDPVELAIPLGMIASDVALRELLTRLANHPQVIQVFGGTLTGKVLGMAGKLGQRIPIVGGALATYGLIQSGKALITTDSHDPNRPYYAHLLANNLITVGTMAAEATVSLPFWPVLALFTALTVDQVVTEGTHIHDSLLHLQDDENHPLLQFYRKFKLGLGIVDADINITEEQRQLFQHFLDYLDKVKNAKGADAIVAVTLPAIRRYEVRKVITPGQKAFGCAPPPFGRPKTYPYHPVCIQTRLAADKKGDYSFELGEEKTFCERRDPFYVENQANNYTLLVGTESFDCSLGQKKHGDSLAKANGENAAALLINTQFKDSNQTGVYRVFLPVDPFYVANYTFKLKKNSGETASSELNHYLPCVNDSVYCINKISVVIAKLYPIADDIRANTQITINDDELRNEVSTKGVQTIEYLISNSHKLSIAANQIPEQTFAFFSTNHVLRFSGLSLISDRGFQAPLTARKLTLEFTDKAQVAGSFVPDRGQQLIINQLTGISQVEKAILNITQCELFSVSLGKNTQLIDQSLELDIEGNFTQAILDIYRHGKEEHSFYHLTQSINDCVVSVRNRESVALSIVAKDKQAFRTITLTNRQEENEVSAIFSGSYDVNGQTCYARIIFTKTTIGWESNLEINASLLNATQLVYLESIRRQHFTKLSMLTPHLGNFKTTHYFFNQSTNLPINGKFIDYRLKGSAEGWILILKHEKPNEETQIFLAETVSEITIGNIRYQVKPAFASLWPVGTVDNTPIVMQDLIAPLNIETSFAETEISLADHVYKIGSISVAAADSKRMINFADQSLPFSYLKYVLKVNQAVSLATVSPALHLNDQLAVALKPMMLTDIEEPPAKNWLERINGFLLGSAVVVTTVIGAGFFMVSKCFKRSNARNRPLEPMISAIPLLNTLEAVSAQLMKENRDHVTFNADTSYDLNETLVKIKADIKPIINCNDKCSERSSALSSREINSQLLFVDYLVRRYKKTKMVKTDARCPKARKITTKNKTVNFPFYAHSIAAADYHCHMNSEPIAANATIKQLS